MNSSARIEFPRASKSAGCYLKDLGLGLKWNFAGGIDHGLNGSDRCEFV